VRKGSIVVRSRNKFVYLRVLAIKFLTGTPPLGTSIDNQNNKIKREIKSDKIKYQPNISPSQDF
jgi:hypothetical protein